MRPAIARTRLDLDSVLAAHRALRSRVALVPTMGALHTGHEALLRRAAEEAPVVVASVFVNPTQFGPDEDFDRYPRTLEADVALMAGLGVDVVFLPEVVEVYPEGPGAGTIVDPGGLGAVLEGAVRPTHFRGVLTVVAKLLGMVRPDVAVFGEKDYQQLVLVRRLVRDLALPVRVVGEPVVREPDGLALSSRNAYLGAGQRGAALALSQALAEGRRHADRGADAVLDAARRRLASSETEVDYVALTDPELGPPPDAGAARLLVAGRVGGTRLVDNTGLWLGAAVREPAVSSTGQEG
ncbi:MAG: pantoate--beta-alanine ligase [Actinomycetota bacterium]|nr:pantoate--beta-alanine ligase [Actinomycetota bacterium]